MIIYKATNTINNKVYIGQTSKTLEERKKRHRQDSIKQNSYFYKAIRKYGFENFIWEIIDDTAKTREELNILEKYYINVYQSFENKNKGYNSTSGGDYNYKLSKEECEKRKERVSGEKNPMYGKVGTWSGKHFSKEHRENLSKSLKGRPAPWVTGANSPNAKAIINLTTGEIFSTISEAAKKYSVIPDAISNHLRGLTKSSAECLWAYCKDVDLSNLILQQPKNHKPHRQKVIHVESGLEFSTISETANYFGCAHKSISDCIKGKREDYKGNHFIGKK